MQKNPYIWEAVAKNVLAFLLNMPLEDSNIQQID